MTAFDADDPSTDNAALRYNIIRQSPDKPSPNMFYIDAERGDIVTVISPTLLDREEHWCDPASRIQMSVSPFTPLTRARRWDDCFSGRVTNARTSIGFAGGRGILAVVRHLANSLIEMIHTHPSILVLSNKLG
ncbi:hypothetical protein AMECASPLE_021816 [Ameca splendens]|uniref:Cadherin domain-containing protein n=1 Tax=Ameca splendens TaxID=208324 RepID=A0ABV1AC69_9TELE